MTTQIIPVFMVTNTDMVAYTATTMASILYNSKSNIDFYIMDCGLSDFDKKQLSTLKDRFSNMASISFSTVDMTVFEGMNTWYYGMLDAWAMLLFPEAFPEVEKVVHVESDTLLVDDIAKLYHENLGKYTVAAAPEIAFSAISDMFPSPTHKYFNLGMIVINCVQWRKENVTEKCIELGKKIWQKI